MLSFFTVPLVVQIAVIFGFGVIIGSFLNVVLYRLHTGKSLSGSSHCLSCGQNLRSYDLIPVISYLFLRGRCRTCAAHIPVRYLVVEFLTGALFVLVLLTVGNQWSTLILGCLFAAILVVVAVYDLRHLIIPDELVFALTGVAMVSVGLELWAQQDPFGFFMTIGAAFLGSAFFFFLWRASQGKWIGFGDVKLAFPLGLMVGCAGIFSMIVLSFWVGAFVGVLLLGLQYLARRGKRPLRFLRRTITMKSALPFAPFLILGFLLVWFWQIDVISLLTYAP